MPMEQKLTYKDIQNKISDKIMWENADNILGAWKTYQNVSGVYTISVDSIYVYIGQSTNLMQRMLEHCYMIRFPEQINIYENSNYKYQLLNQIRNRVKVIPLLVLEQYDKKQLDAIEALYIRMYEPYFNVFIPKLDGSLDFYNDYSTDINDFEAWLFDKLSAS